MKPKLLVIELWGVGDLVLGTPFLCAASQQYDVTLLAKPYAQDLQQRFWPKVKVVSFVAPWTAFKGKYHLLSWPWGQLFRLRRALHRERFDVGLSARWDPRDHVLLRIFGAKLRFGFPRLRSRLFLTNSLRRPDPEAHRYENWRVLAQALNLPLPTRLEIPLPINRPAGQVLVHSGAGQPVRVWPLERYQNLICRLRERNYSVQVACDPDPAICQRAGSGLQTLLLCPTMERNEVEPNSWRRAAKRIG